MLAMEAKELADSISALLESIKAALVFYDKVLEDFQVALDRLRTLIPRMELDEMQVRVAK